MCRVVAMIASFVTSDRFIQMPKADESSRFPKLFEIPFRFVLVEFDEQCDQETLFCVGQDTIFFRGSRY